VKEKCCVFNRVYLEGKPVLKMECRNKPYLKTRASRKTMPMVFCYKHAEGILTPGQIKRGTLL
jgi:hypothetical protein